MAQEQKPATKSGGSLFQKIISSFGGGKQTDSEKKVTRVDINSARVFGLGEARSIGGISTREAIALIERNSSARDGNTQVPDIFSASRLRDKPGHRVGAVLVPIDLKQPRHFDSVNNIFPNSSQAEIDSKNGAALVKPTEETKENLTKIENASRVRRAREIARKSGYEASANLVRSVVKHGAGGVPYLGEERIRKMVLGEGKERFALQIDSESLSQDRFTVRDDLRLHKKKNKASFTRGKKVGFEGGDTLRAPKSIEKKTGLFVRKNLTGLKLMSSWLVTSSMKRQAALAIQPSYFRIDDDRPNTDCFFVRGSRSGEAHGHSIMRSNDGIGQPGELSKSIVHVFRSRLTLRSNDKHFSFHSVEKRSFDSACFFGWTSACDTSTSGSSVVTRIESFISSTARLEGFYFSKALEQGKLLASALKKSSVGLSKTSLDSVDLSLNERFSLYRDHGALYSESLVEFISSPVSFRGKSGTLAQLICTSAELEQSEISQGVALDEYSFGLILCHVLMLCQELKSVSSRAYLVLALLDKLIRKTDLIKGKGSLSDDEHGDDASELRSLLLAETQAQSKETECHSGTLGASIVFLGASGEAKNFLKLQNKASVPASEIEFLCRNMPSIRKILIKEGALFKSLENEVKALISL